MYEVRLKIEFKFLQMLAIALKGIINILYKERRGGDYKSITEQPSSGLYPNEFRVEYIFPKMYVGPNKIKRNWRCMIEFAVPETILMNKNSQMGVRLVNGPFAKGDMPYNNHVSKNFICTGSAWSIAQQGYGIWYFIILVGCILNLEEFMIDSSHPHLNGEALDFWITKRHKQPTNDIKWPFDLNTRTQSSNNGLSGIIRIGKGQILPNPIIKILGKTPSPSIVIRKK